MRMPRVVAVLALCAAALAVLACPAAARGARRSNNNNNRRNTEGGRYRIISGDRETDQDRRKRQQEEKRAKEQEQREAEREQKRAQQEKKKAAEQAKRDAAQQAKQRLAAKAKTTRTKPKAKGGKAKGAAKDDDQGEAEAAQLCEQAEALFEEGELLPGVALLRQCIGDYGGSDPAKGAETRLAQLLEHEKLGPMILHGEGEELFGSQRYRRAWSKFGELLDKFPDCEQAAAAAGRLAEIREGDLLSKTVYTDEELEDARFWLLVGNIHSENRRAGDALAAWRRVIEQFPGCPYAEQAEGKLVAARGPAS